MGWHQHGLPNARATQPGGQIERRAARRCARTPLPDQEVATPTLYIDTFHATRTLGPLALATLPTGNIAPRRHLRTLAKGLNWRRRAYPFGDAPSSPGRS